MQPTPNPARAFEMKPLALLLMSLTLAGCLSGGGGSSNKAVTEPPPASESPANPPTTEEPPEEEPPAEEPPVEEPPVEEPPVEEPTLGALEFQTAQGVVAARELDGMLALQGVRYANVPARFAPAAPLGEADAWEGTQTRYEVAAPCAQIPSSNNGNTSSTNEDCLTLNIYLPAEMKNKPEDANFPVMVWFHGGAFIGGSGNGVTPGRLVDEGVIVISVNYRLGALGMISLPEMSEANLNLGLQDQQEALRWVEKNIAGMGGDPENVTIFGQSAGGYSVLAHLLSPGATGLFDKAIVQSGSYVSNGSPRSFANAKGSRLASYLPGYTECSAEKTDLECLREAPIEALLAAEAQEAQTSGVVGYTPVPGGDGNVLPRSLTAGLDDPLNQVPVIIGSTTGEGWLYVRPLENRETYRAAVGGTFGVLGYPVLDIADQYESQAPVLPAGYRIAYSRAYTDGWYACWTLDHAEKLRTTAPTWMYWFNETSPLAVGTAAEALGPLTAAHTVELPFLLLDDIWNEWASRDPAIITEEARALSAQMIAYWSEFAKSGNPNAGDLPFWSDSPGDLKKLGSNLQELGENTGSFSAFHQCPAWRDWGVGSP